MTNAEFKKLLAVNGDNLMKDTCYKLRVEIVKKIVNCTAVSTASKDAMLMAYMNNNATNNAVLGAIKQFINR